MEVWKAQNSWKAASHPCQPELLLHHHLLCQTALTRRDNEQGWVFPYLPTCRLHQALWKEANQTSSTEETTSACNSWTLLQTLMQAVHGFGWKLPHKALFFLFLFLNPWRKRAGSGSQSALSSFCMFFPPIKNRVQIGTTLILCFVKYDLELFHLEIGNGWRNGGMKDKFFSIPTEECPPRSLKITFTI